MNKVVVLGARRGNIGGAIVERMVLEGWDAVDDDCEIGRGEYEPPTVGELGNYDACVITLGTDHGQPFAEQDDNDIKSVLRGSLEIPLIAARRYVDGRGGAGGTIVFTGSFAHNHVFTNHATYCVAKAGLSMAVKALAWELMPKFKVHIVHPSTVDDTPMLRQTLHDMVAAGRSNTEAMAHMTALLKMPELLTKDQVAEVVAWLLTSPAAAWTAGTGIELPGGTR